MKLKFLAQSLVVAGLLATGVSSHASEDYTYTRPGTLGADDSFGYTSANRATGVSFTDTIFFTTSALSSLVTSAVDNTYSGGDLSKIQNFAGSILTPNGTTYVLGNPYDDGGSQGFSGEFTNVPAGLYKLTVSGTIGSSAGGYTVSISTTPVPEPETYALLVAGLGLLGFVGARRKSA